jgi:hypothetical protein
MEHTFVWPAPHQCFAHKLYFTRCVYALQPHAVCVCVFMCVSWNTPLCGLPLINALVALRRQANGTVHRAFSTLQEKHRKHSIAVTCLCLTRHTQAWPPCLHLSFFKSLKPQPCNSSPFDSIFSELGLPLPLLDTIGARGHKPSFYTYIWASLVLQSECCLNISIPTLEMFTRLICAWLSCEQACYAYPTVLP